MSLEIIQNDEGSESSHITSDGKAVSWVNSRVNPWIEWRDTNYEANWDEYYRLWRGISIEKDKLNKSERSKLITPALQQAIEATVAELEEATFGKGKWFDVTDDVKDIEAGEQKDIKPFRDLLQEDLDKAGARGNISEIYLNSALYGTGIGKVVTTEIEVKNVSTAPVDESKTVYEAAPEVKTEMRVEIIPISPYEFAIDPTSKSIEDSIGCAHVFAMPKHQVMAKQEEGVYKDVEVGSYSGDMKLFEDETKSSASDLVKITEYHGLFPRALLDDDTEYEDLSEDIKEDKEESKELDVFNQQDGNDEAVGVSEDDDLVESIVIIANDQFILRAKENANFMQDRAFVAYQHDTVPNRFWGRGIAEKGYWPQKANDAEVRARIDAMALSVRPMMGVDATRLPRGGKLSIEAGKVILTNGDPSQILKPFNFNSVNNNTFHQSGELERMVQMGTGAMDSATPTGISSRNSTASGMSMISSGSIKRAKRTMANIGFSLLNKFVEKAAWRMMQFAPKRYPVQDIKFKATSTLGLMARELEQQQLTTLLQTTEPNGTGYWMLMKSIYENSSISDREQMVSIAEQKLQESMQPPQPDPLAQMKQQEMQAKQQSTLMSLQIEKTRAETERMRVIIEGQKADSQEAKDLTAAMLNIAKAESEESGRQLSTYKAAVDAMTAQSAGAINAATKPAPENPTGSPTGAGNPPQPV